MPAQVTDTPGWHPNSPWPGHPGPHQRVRAGVGPQLPPARTLGLPSGSPGPNSLGLVAQSPLVPGQRVLYSARTLSPRHGPSFREYASFWAIMVNICGSQEYDVSARLSPHPTLVSKLALISLQDYVARDS